MSKPIIMQSFNKDNSVERIKVAFDRKRDYATTIQGLLHNNIIKYTSMITLIVSCKLTSLWPFTDKITPKQVNG